jgi:hypothetical protein
VTDIFGTTNDTLRFNFQVNAPGSYGQIFTTIEGMADSMSYLIQLMQPNREQIIAQQVLEGVETGEAHFTDVPPQTYFIRIVEDANGNGRWDTGNFAQQRQPERVLNQTLEPLRADWDLDVTIVWKTRD